MATGRELVNRSCNLQRASSKGAVNCDGQVATSKPELEADRGAGRSAADWASTREGCNRPSPWSPKLKGEEHTAIGKGGKSCT